MIKPGGVHHRRAHAVPQLHRGMHAANSGGVLCAGAGRGGLHGPDQQAGGWLLLLLARGIISAAAAGVAPVSAAEWGPQGTPAAGGHRHPPSTTAEHAWSPRAGSGRDSPAEGEWSLRTPCLPPQISVRIAFRNLFCMLLPI